MAIFTAPTYFETDEQLVLIACLMLLEQRYRLLQSMTLQDIVDEIEEIMEIIVHHNKLLEENDYKGV